MGLKQAEQSDIKQILDGNGIIYKHSPRCGMSASRKEVVEKLAEDTDIFLIDVLGQRDLSNHIAEELDLKHESPQLIGVENGEAVWHKNHMAITEEAVSEHI